MFRLQIPNLNTPCSKSFNWIIGNDVMVNLLDCLTLDTGMMSEDDSRNPLAEVSSSSEEEAATSPST